ncbi:MAG TPA: sigma-70 family RNA polymerase sigma factor [Acidobacteriaceae bacterium]|nr:sigma-70 family RNA polymerase sigma factor [Acidobacteriaceae bacterium]
MAVHNQSSALNDAIERDEVVLIRRICAGQKGLFHELIRPYEKGIYWAAYSILRNQGDVEEVTQEALLKVFEHLDQLRSDTKFKSWLMRIVMNEARMRRRKNHDNLFESIEEQAVETEEGDFMPRQYADWREVPSEALDKKETRTAVRDALESLPQMYREVLFLREVQQLSVEEVSGILSISIAAVKTRSHRARLQMRERLTPMFGKRWSDRLPFLKGRKPW